MGGRVASTVSVFYFNRTSLHRGHSTDMIDRGQDGGRGEMGARKKGGKSRRGHKDDDKTRGKGKGRKRG